MYQEEVSLGHRHILLPMLLILPVFVPIMSESDCVLSGIVRCCPRLIAQMSG